MCLTFILNHWLIKGIRPYRRALLIGIAGFCIYGWCWNLLFSLFYPLPNPIFPWSAFMGWFHLALFPAKERLWFLLTLILPLLLIAVLIVKDKQQRYLKTLFGNAHWASVREIQKMGLFGKRGLIIGWKQGKLLRAPLSSHLLVFAPSRSGKGVSQVMPNALTFPDSLVVVDIKQEIFQDTSGFRAKLGQQVYLFSPGNSEGKTHRWNPLDLVNSHPARLIADLQLIAQVLIPSDTSGDNMWLEEARALATGLLLWLKASGRPFTLGEFANIVKGTPNFVEFLKDIVNSSENNETNSPLHPVAYRNLTNFIQKAPKEQSGVKSSLTAKLNLWDDPFIHAATCASDFDIRQMRQQCMTVYLGIATNQLIRLAPLMNLFIQLFLNVMTEHLPTVAEPMKVLVMLDEFCALGRMETLKKGFGFLAGYHVHLMAIIQNVGQFYELYGGRDHCDVFFQNTDYKIVYRQNERTDQEFVSQQLGTRTVKIKSQSYSGHLLNAKPPSTTESFISRPLLTPEEVRTFPAQQGIIIVNGQPPIAYQRILHYCDDPFKRLIYPPVAISAIEPCYPLPVTPVKVPSTDNTHQPLVTLIQQLINTIFLIQQTDSHALSTSTANEESPLAIDDTFNIDDESIEN